MALAEAHPDVDLCVVDLHMPGLIPLEGLTGLRQRVPRAKIVVVTGSESDDDLLSALELGVDGFVPKTVEPGVVEAALRLVLAGGRYVPERVAGPSLCWIGAQRQTWEPGRSWRTAREQQNSASPAGMGAPARAQ